MNTPSKFFAAAVCGLLLGLPAAAQADEYWPMEDIFIHFGTQDNKLTVSPAELTLQAGEIYRIVVINPSTKSHVVAAPELAATGLTVDLLKGTPKVDYPTAAISAGISVRPGQMMEWTFMPIQEGRYKLGCNQLFHKAAGMHAMIEVVYEVL